MCLEDLAVGGNAVCCLIIFVIFIGLGRAYIKVGGVLKLSYEGESQKSMEKSYGTPRDIV